MSEWKSKRFWEKASSVPSERGFRVQLDGRPVKTPAKAPLEVPTENLASAIAAEWDAQEETIDPNSMPCTQSANAAIDKVSVQREEVAALIAAYGDSDLLCYRADGPVELVEQQNLAWNPLLNWTDSVLNAPLSSLSGVIHVPQASNSLATLRAEVRAQDNFALTALHDLVSLSGSLIIGLAALRDFQPIKTLWSLSRIDEDWQIAQWGEDEEATATASRKKAAFLHAKRFFDLSRS